MRCQATGGLRACHTVADLGMLMSGLADMLGSGLTAAYAGHGQRLQKPCGAWGVHDGYGMQGSCEHTLAFMDVRLIHSHDTKLAGAYPLPLYKVRPLHSAVQALS